MQRRKGGPPNDGWIPSDMPSESDLRGARLTHASPAQREASSQPSWSRVPSVVASGAGAVAACGAAPSARADEEHPATRRSADPKPIVVRAGDECDRLTGKQPACR